MVEEPVIIAAAGRPYPGETVSGDAWQVDHQARGSRIAVVDGLGHGAPAAEAAASALQVLAAHPELGPGEALRACHAALFHTRGAAMWLVSIDCSSARLTYAGVGNVDAQLWQAGRPVRLVAQRGIVGAALPTVRSFEHALKPGWTLVIHTDGVREQFGSEVMTDFLEHDAQALADSIIDTWSRASDDALVVVAQHI